MKILKKLRVEKDAEAIAEIAGYVYCTACEDLIDQSEWFNHADENFVGQKFENSNENPGFERRS